MTLLIDIHYMMLDPVGPLRWIQDFWYRTRAWRVRFGQLYRSQGHSYQVSREDTFCSVKVGDAESFPRFAVWMSLLHTPRACCMIEYERAIR